jgi:protein-disulfide isomerase
MRKDDSAPFEDPIPMTDPPPVPPLLQKARRGMLRVPGLVVSAALLFACGWFARDLRPNAEAQARPEKPIAIVGGESIYERDYLASVEAQVQKVRQQEYELRRQALDDVINKKLLAEEAKRKGTTPEEILAGLDKQVPEPSEEQVEQQLVQQMFGGGISGNMSKEQIREDMIQRVKDQVHEVYYQALRDRAGVKVYLLPPRQVAGIDPARIRGNPDAPITIVEFSDFQCPYCLQAYTTVKELLKKYDGKVRLAYRDLPLSETESEMPGGGAASRCAGEQGKFWEYHDLLFENQDYYGQLAFEDFATQLNLDIKAFNTCMESGKYKPMIKADFDEGIRLGARGTPYFFINGVPVNGARPQADFEQVIEAELFLMAP